MQHGTGREFVRDIIENVEAVLRREVRRNLPTGDLRANLRQALLALEVCEDLDKTGEYGPDYGQPFEQRWTEPDEVDKWPVTPCTCGQHGPVGTIRDTRPERLGR